MDDDTIRRIEAALEAKALTEAATPEEFASAQEWLFIVCPPTTLRYLLDRLKAAERRAEYWKSAHLAANTEIERLSAEIERLKRWEGAAREWLDKTEWVQERIDSGHLPAKYLGKHRADIMRAEVDRLRATLARLACLGNGDRYGNSEGNMIARAALENTNEG